MEVIVKALANTTITIRMDSPDTIVIVKQGSPAKEHSPPEQVCPPTASTIDNAEPSVPDEAQPEQVHEPTTSTDAAVADDAAFTKPDAEKPKQQASTKKDEVKNASADKNEKQQATNEERSKASTSVDKSEKLQAPARKDASDAQADSLLKAITISPSLGSLMTWTIDPSTTVHSLKQRIQAKLGIPIEAQLLSTLTHVLKDNHKFSRYANQNGEIPPVFIRTA
ncbi:hypothetical protein SYNPS1DRAFT_27589 [Syncephalis pseudoplumigaleata]|uniref:Ubiquitin-like domain-containing protein n=1 Tax=Syncephalis pseudoplumigaleata TaxID=1712513 RepID=A0A4P9Z555_9FUNG|nr:hypothetical protein SYNPS1DRAFT_27589 [Syncephalis pseudoplumigaleata]|eukprot:RKP26730.1 hypothetical protein SYNPS1DRAFT_27589 [Syncephalis pseudoplumigaleata]